MSADTNAPIATEMQPAAHGGSLQRFVRHHALTHLDLFSGIGGFALAAQAAGFTTIGFSEIEPYACKILKRHWPDVPNYGDIRNITRKVLADAASRKSRESQAGHRREDSSRGSEETRPAENLVDLITGGFPCQPFSLAGKRRGANDDRAIWPEMCRVIAEARPRWVLGENVPGIISMELDGVLSDLEAIGYSTGTLVIPACAVDARHRRDRVWVCARRIVADADSAGLRQSDNAISGEPSEQSDSDFQPDSNAKLKQCVQCCEEQDSGHTGISPEPKRVGREFPRRSWPTEPDVGRVAHGVPHRSHRLHGLGNAIVPQVAETLLHWMLEIHEGRVMANDCNRGCSQSQP